ncbi:MAG: PIN domain-containing protein [Actinomycetota bacterium]|nr:PIN domain-containing protein [Actinomycetota bacterium]
MLRVGQLAAPELLERARHVLDSVTLLTLSTETFEVAGRLAPAAMRSLDSLHLAAALRLGDDLDALVTYDDRLADAARFNGALAVGPA